MYVFNRYRFINYATILSFFRSSLWLYEQCLLISAAIFINLPCSEHALTNYWIHFCNVYYVFAHIRVKYSSLFTCWYNFLGSECSYKLNIAYVSKIRRNPTSDTPPWSLMVRSRSTLLYIYKFGKLQTHTAVNYKFGNPQVQRK